MAGFRSSTGYTGVGARLLLPSEGPDKDTLAALHPLKGTTECTGIKTKEPSRVSGEAPSARVVEPKREG